MQTPNPVNPNSEHVNPFTCFEYRGYDCRDVAVGFRIDASQVSSGSHATIPNTEQNNLFNVSKAWLPQRLGQHRVFSRLEPNRLWQYSLLDAEVFCYSVERKTQLAPPPPPPRKYNSRFILNPRGGARGGGGLAFMEWRPGMGLAGL